MDGDRKSGSGFWIFAVATAVCLVGTGLVLLDAGALGAMFGVVAAILAAYMAGVTRERGHR
jgi:hypothetical protein